MSNFCLKLNDINKLINQCEQSKLISFAYQDSTFSIQFSKVDKIRDSEKLTQVKNEKNIIDELAITEILENDSEKDENIINILSPFVGTVEFSNQIKLATRDIHIDKDDVLCSIEAMKIYNDIKSPVSGTIVDILVNDCSLVEYEQSIMKIRVDRDE